MLSYRGAAVHVRVIPLSGAVYRCLRDGSVPREAEGRGGGVGDEDDDNNNGAKAELEEVSDLLRLGRALRCRSACLAGEVRRGGRGGGAAIVVVTVVE